MSAVILFDGICNFCNSSVNFVIERDTAGYFKFAPLQSAAGEELIAQHLGDISKTDSVILVDNGRAFFRSEAALRIAEQLPRPWKWLRIFRIVPRPIRDWFYDLFAKFRYRFFGKRDACMLPTPDVRARFLD